MAVINHCRCVTCPRLWWLLAFDGRKKPYAGGYIEDEDVIEELAWVPTSEDVEAAKRSSAFGEVKERVSSPWSWESYRSIEVILHKMPFVLGKVEVVHVIEEV